MSASWFPIFSQAFVLVPIGIGLRLNQLVETMATVVMAVIGLVFTLCQEGYCGTSVQLHIAYMEIIVHAICPAVIVANVIPTRNKLWSAAVLFLFIFVSTLMSYNELTRNSSAVAISLVILGFVNVGAFYAAVWEKKPWRKLNIVSLVASLVLLLVAYIFRYALGYDLNSIYLGFYQIFSFLSTAFGISINNKNVLFGFYVRTNNIQGT